MQMEEHDLFGIMGKVAVVTGGGGGIGRAFSLALAEAGVTVVIVDIDFSAARKTLELLRQAKGKGAAFKVDVRQLQQVNSLIRKIVSRYKILSILVNNAGMNIPCAAEEMEYAQWQNVIDVNLTGVFLCAQACGRQMIKHREGVIINIASIYGQVGSQLHSAVAYNASKAGVVNLTRSLAVEWAKYGIRVNAIAPGYVRSDLIRKRLDDLDYVRKMMERTPLGRIADPEDLVGALIFLASPASAMVTSHILNVDGGWLAI